MKVKQIMSRQVECVMRDSTLEEAARKMKELDVGALPVVDRGKPAGVVTDRDLVLCGIAEGKDPAKTSVAEVMSQDIHWCDAEDELEEAGSVMSDKGVRRVLVRNGERKLAGILSLGDIAANEPTRRIAGRVLAKVSGAC